MQTGGLNLGEGAIPMLESEDSVKPEDEPICLLSGYGKPVMPTTRQPRLPKVTEQYCQWKSVARCSITAGRHRLHQRPWYRHTQQWYKRRPGTHAGVWNRKRASGFFYKILHWAYYECCRKRWSCHFYPGLTTQFSAGEPELQTPHAGAFLLPDNGWKPNTPSKTCDDQFVWIWR